MKHLIQNLSHSRISILFKVTHGISPIVDKDSTPPVDVATAGDCDCSQLPALTLLSKVVPE